jgi:antitoxin (DNA-binding transcriptional repressor) of toxin-antitoxin stability system
MKTVLASQLREETLSQMRDSDGEGVLVVQEGRTVAKLVPVDPAQKPLTASEVIATYKDKVKINGEILSTGRWWDAEFGHSYHPVRDQSDADAAGEGGA